MAAAWSQTSAFITQVLDRDRLLTICVNDILAVKQTEGLFIFILITNRPFGFV
jgi:hypothetical protein